MKIQKVTQNFMTDRMDETIRFYTEMLGFTLSAHVPEEAPYVWAQLSSGEAELMFQSRESMAEGRSEFKDLKVGSTSGMFMEVQGLKELHEKLLRMHVHVSDLEQTFYGMNECHLKDSNGYLITLAEPAAQ